MNHYISKMSITLQKRNIEDIVCLTPTQVGMLYYYMKDKSSDEYNVRVELSLKGQVYVDVFKKAWETVVESNEVLRTTYRWEMLKEPVQIVLKKHNLDFKYFDLEDKNVSEFNKYQNELQEKPDLTGVPFKVVLCKKSAMKYHLNIITHHIVFDGWGSSILFKEFFEIYFKLTKGQNAYLNAKPKFKKYCTWLKGINKGQNTAYWSKYLKDCEKFHLADLICNKMKKEARYVLDNVSFELSKENTEKIKELAGSLKVSVQAFIMLIWGVMLSKISNRKNVMFGIVVSGRPPVIRDVDKMVGLFINTIPIVLRFDDKLNFLELAKEFKESIVEQEPYQYYPLIDIQSITNNKKLFDHFLTFLDYPVEEELLNPKKELYVSSINYHERSDNNIDILINLGKEIKFNFRFNSNLFPKKNIEMFPNYLQNIIDQILRDPKVMFDEVFISSSLNRAEKVEDLLFEEGFNL